LSVTTDSSSSTTLVARLPVVLLPVVEVVLELLKS
jgi:hypothetical protein